MYKATVIGHFDWQGNNMIGAVVKARNILEQLNKEYGESILNVDIYGWRNHKRKIILGIINAFRHSQNIILVISDTSIGLMKLIDLLKKFFHRKVLYCVVGGDIAEKLIGKRVHVNALKSVDMFFVETVDCLEQMHILGLKNTRLLKNFKCIDPIEIKEDYRFKKPPFYFCTFSRVIEQKGITDAISAIEEINKLFDECICRLDIYGVLDPTYEDEFNKLMKKNKSCRYCGSVSSEKAVDILKNYYCLLFPTKYQTEGIPGTIIDGFAAGLPVICSNWKRCNQIVSDNIDGFVYPFGSYQGLIEKILYAVNNVDVVEIMRKNCIHSFETYRPENAIKVLLQSLS